VNRERERELVCEMKRRFFNPQTRVNSQESESALLCFSFPLFTLCCVCVVSAARELGIMWQNTALIAPRTLSVAAVSVATRASVPSPYADLTVLQIHVFMYRGLQRESSARQMSSSLIHFRGRPGFDSQKKRFFFLDSTASLPTLGLTQPHIQRVPGLKRPVREADAVIKDRRLFI
jgi:hypothetical protein